ncbi:MAG TPA: hypothetical protein VEI97_05240 [bacterium]|nr:hypothetical protein [bacterium]
MTDATVTPIETAEGTEAPAPAEDSAQPAADTPAAEPTTAGSPAADTLAPEAPAAPREPRPDTGAPLDGELPEEELPADHDRRDLPDFGRRKKEPRTFEEKLRAYKKQSQERLLDIKRSRENKIGGKKPGGGRGR